MKIDGTSRMVLVLGDPIAQVRSPAGMTAAFAARGKNVIVMPAHVSSADLPKMLEGADRIRNLDGMIATIPHKFAVYRHCTTATPRAHALQAVNVFRRTGENTWHGDMTDGVGFVGALRHRGCDPSGQYALLVGAGGAGAAIGLALLEAGVTRLAIHDADTARRDALIARLAALHPGRVAVGSADPRPHTLICNASPAGMRPGDPMPVTAEHLAPAMFVGCVITAPAISPIVAAARARGCPTSTGGDMYEAAQNLLVDFLLDSIN